MFEFAKIVGVRGQRAFLIRLAGQPKSQKQTATALYPSQDSEQWPFVMYER